MKKGATYIGTSGWHYKHWKRSFYPEGIKEADQLAYYKSRFNTVELNNSFYALPGIKTFNQWRRMTPADFHFSVKASRYITHMKKLKPDKSSIRKFFSHAGKLKEKLGPVLFQLPPRWKMNAQRLADFIPLLPPGNRYVFEFRDPSWYHDTIYSILRAHHAAFCIYELDGHISPAEVTADFVYIRLHGPGKKYQGKYTVRQLTGWAKRCKAWNGEGRDVYVYFDND